MGKGERGEEKKEEKEVCTGCHMKPVRFIGSRMSGQQQLPRACCRGGKVQRGRLLSPKSMSKVKTPF